MGYVYPKGNFPYLSIVLSFCARLFVLPHFIGIFHTIFQNLLNIQTVLIFFPFCWFNRKIHVEFKIHQIVSIILFLSIYSSLFHIHLV